MIWTGGLAVTLWHHRDPAVIPMRHHCGRFMTPLWPACDIAVRLKSFMWSVTFWHVVQFIIASGWSLKWAVSSGPLWSTTSHPHWVSSPTALETAIFDLGDLHTWPVRSLHPQPFDHILMNHVTTPPAPGWECSYPGVPYITQTHYDCTCSCVFVRWVSKRMYFKHFDLLAFYIMISLPL